MTSVTASPASPAADPPWALLLALSKGIVQRFEANANEMLLQMRVWQLDAYISLLDMYPDATAALRQGLERVGVRLPHAEHQEQQQLGHWLRQQQQLAPSAGHTARRCKSSVACSTGNTRRVSTTAAAQTSSARSAKTCANVSSSGGRAKAALAPSPPSFPSYPRQLFATVAAAPTYLPYLSAMAGMPLLQRIGMLTVVMAAVLLPTCWRRWSEARLIRQEDEEIVRSGKDRESLAGRREALSRWKECSRLHAHMTPCSMHQSDTWNRMHFVIPCTTHQRQICNPKLTDFTTSLRAHKIHATPNPTPDP